MNRLARRIAALIAAQGPISVADFMAQALYDREAGYYATRAPFGAEGDFITAPEISQMFGEMLGLWLVQAWHDQGRPKRPRLVELGPGRGTLMADAMRAIAAAAPDFRKGADVTLIETSPVLQAAQEEKLKDAGVPIAWAQRFEPARDGRPLYLLANEFFDCLPVRQYVKTERGWCERMVTVTDGALAFALAPVPVASALIPADRAGAPPGGVYETAPAATALAEEIARTVGTGGAALIVDYGYDRPGFGETLQAVSAHSFAEVLAAPGESDLSAHVDFAALAAAGKRGGAAVYGPRGQGDFLADLGLAARAERLMRANPAQSETVRAAAERLLSPARMGTLFKALAFAAPSAPPVPGFAP